MLLAAYNANRKDAAEPLLEESAVATAILEKFEDLLDWSGTPAELYQHLTNCFELRSARSVHCASPLARKILAAMAARWPKDQSQFAKELRASHHSFACMGWPPNSVGAPTAA